MPREPLGSVLRHLRRMAGDSAGGDLTDAQLLERYVATHDGDAFATLVRRHGRLVRSVCRHVLRREQDIDDVFQVTFLVFAAKAASIRKTGSVASWLYGVAYRTAMNAKRAEIRRSEEPREVEGRSTRQPVTEAALREVQAILDEEVHGLAEKYRAPFVLCCLEGKSRAEAAAELGWKEGTVSSRLAQARKELKRRLARRGVVLSAALCAVELGRTAASAAVPPALANGTIQGALAFAAGQAVAADLVSAEVASLAKGVLQTMFTTKLQIATAVLLAVGFVAGAGLWTRQALAGKPANGQAQAPAEAKKPPAARPDGGKAPAGPKKDEAGTVAYRGRVLGPDKKPVAGAKVYLAPWWGYHFEPFTSPASATTGPDGRFTFTAPRAEAHQQAAIVSAAAPNLGIGWVGLHKDDKRTDLTLRLVADDVPITGQVVDLEGKAVAGATLRVLQIMASPQEDLGPWLEATRDKKAPASNRSTDLEQEYLSRYTTAPTPAVTTDAAGRFRLTGIGRERLAIVQLDGPTIASEYLHIRTRPGKPFEVPWAEADPEYGTPRMATIYYGSDFRHAAGPTKPIVGVVRDKDTKKLLAGVTVRSEKLAHNPLHGRRIVQTTTDAQGRYRLIGMPKGEGNQIQVVPPKDLPYVTPNVEVPDSPGLGPVTVEVELKRGVWIEGQLTDKATGQPVRGSLMYLVRDGNPHLRDYPGFYGGLPGVGTSEDGTYRIIGLPGPGLIVVWRKENYLLGAERDDEDGLKEAFGYMPQGNFAAFARIDPARGVEAVKRDIALVPGWTFTGTVLGPDGKPLTGAVMAGQRHGMKTAEFTVRQFNPRRPRPLFFRYPEKGWVGVVHPPKANGGSVTVRMEAGAAVIGRVVDADGAPRAGVELRVLFRPKGEPHWNEEYLPEPIKTDREGRFRIGALPPGFDYFLYADRREVRFGSDLLSGQTTDLGDVRMQTNNE